MLNTPDIVRPRAHPRFRLHSLVLIALALQLVGCEDDEQPTTPPPVGPEFITVAELIASAEPDLAPRWSPDGTMIAFCRGVENEDMHIYLHRLATQSDEQLTDLATAAECFASWSPDGQWIVYDDARNLYISSVDGDSTRQFTSGVGQELFPAWSPDSTQIAFAGEISDLGLPQFDLFVASLTDSSLSRLTATPFDEAEPAWSPDSQRLAFRTTTGTNNTDVFFYDFADSTITQVTGLGSVDVNPAFSPDGRYLAWTSTRSGNAELWVIDVLEPGIPVQLTSNAAIDNAPDWAPDGQSIAFQSQRNGGWDIFLASDLDSLLAASTAGGGAAP